MKLYVVSEDRRLDIFGDPVSEALILNEPLRTWQSRAAAAAGLELEVVASTEGLSPPYFVMGEDVFATERFLDEFVRRARAAGGNSQAGLRSNPVVLRASTGHPSAKKVQNGFVYDLHYVSRRAQKKPSEPILVEMDDLFFSTTRLAKAIEPSGSYTFCESAKAILQIEAPIHLYQANMHQNVARLFSRVPRLGLLSGRVSARDFDAAINANQIGAGCAIHSTAVVEGCQIADGVSIGAHCVVRQSVIGRGASLNEGVILARSTVGEGSVISHQHRVWSSVIYPDCFLISGALQFSIMGRESAVFAAWVTDVRMDRKTIRTPFRGQVIDSGMAYLGVIIGHRAKVTAGVVTAPGRVVPSGAHVHANPSLVYRGFPADHPIEEPLFLG